MFENNRENIHEFLENKSDLAIITLLSNKINVGIVGGGRAGIIKGKTLAERGCNVTILSKEFKIEFKEKFFELENLGVELIKGTFNDEFLTDKHLVVLALPNEEKDRKEDAINYCLRHAKLFIDCSSYELGNVMLPAQGETREITFGISTKGGNPKVAVKLREKIRKDLEQYDEFLKFVRPWRKYIKNLHRNKSDLLEFISTEDFLFMWEKGQGNNIIEMFL